MTIWIFGDSYAQSAQETFYDLKDRPLTWVEHLSKLSGMKVDGEARPGVSQDYLYNAFRLKIDQMKKGDVVVFIHTESQRRWFFKDRPEISNLWMNTFGKLVKKDEAKAIEAYKKYLYNPMLGGCITEMLSTFVNTICMAKQMKMIQIPGFELEERLIHNPYCTVTGNLMNISLGEFKDSKLRNKCFDEARGIDMRLNHMTWPNHEKLAIAIHKSLETREPLDLSSISFDKNVYNTVSEYLRYGKEYFEYFTYTYDESNLKRKMYSINDEILFKYEL